MQVHHKAHSQYCVLKAPAYFCSWTLTGKEMKSPDLQHYTTFSLALVLLFQKLKITMKQDFFMKNQLKLIQSFMKDFII